MRIWVQKSASMQKRTSPLKFGDLAEKSGLNSVSDLSTKVRLAVYSSLYNQLSMRLRCTGRAAQLAVQPGARAGGRYPVSAGPRRRAQPVCHCWLLRTRMKK